MAPVPTLALLGTRDESLPTDLDRHTHMTRLQSALGGESAAAALVHGASHEFTDREQALASVVSQYIQHGMRLPQRGLDIEYVEVL